MSRTVPAWARRRARAREAEATERWYARHGGLVGVGLVDVVWSNSACKPYHVACRTAAPADAFELAIDPDTNGPCGACGRPL